ncbi:hypothetical protein [Mesoflavibacter sp. SCSIO 43206]|uniref:hypothetical protein n=1 Tax=Mesoflavibacter TaxID=444051 RepID=UPI001CA865A2|nr:hypothetical protein [Mesoflavibacter sp. SCSIO 43206]UAB76273.1 hypothetical protein INR78_04580 [Mesoflavibacter sp. SCSIO 43206]
MKKIILICTIILAFGCKDEKKHTETTSTDKKVETKRLVGEFVYYADAAVFQVKNDIYGVILDEKSEALNKEAEPYKKEATDMVIADVEAQIIPKDTNEEGWPYKLKIEKIHSVKALDPNKNDVIKLGK